MNGETNDGGPAFPSADTVHPNGPVQYGTFSMSLLDYFAGQALAGLWQVTAFHSMIDGRRNVSRNSPTCSLNK
jgi:hypothetical protein